MWDDQLEDLHSILQGWLPYPPPFVHLFHRLLSPIPGGPLILNPGGGPCPGTANCPGPGLGPPIGAWPGVNGLGAPGGGNWKLGGKPPGGGKGSPLGRFGGAAPFGGKGGNGMPRPPGGGIIPGPEPAPGIPNGGGGIPAHS